jgi:hypothetical protein
VINAVRIAARKINQSLGIGQARSGFCVLLKGSSCATVTSRFVLDIREQFSTHFTDQCLRVICISFWSKR